MSNKVTSFTISTHSHLVYVIDVTIIPDFFENCLDANATKVPRIGNVANNVGRRWSTSKNFFVWIYTKNIS